MTPPTNPLADRLARVTERCQRAAARAGRGAGAVTLVVVTKTAPPGIFGQLSDLGVTDIGENRIQGAEQRLETCRDMFRTHFIGHLQGNKARRAVPLFDVFHGVDSLALMQRLDRLAAELGLCPELLLQVNVSGEGSKSGLDPAALPEIVAAAADLAAARVVGLMTMAPRAEDPEAVRPVFTGLARLRDAVAASTGASLPELSMGMTQDFEVAIEEGATLVRLGTAIVGPRPNGLQKAKLQKPGPGNGR